MTKLLSTIPVTQPRLQRAIRIDLTSWWSYSTHSEHIFLVYKSTSTSRLYKKRYRKTTFQGSSVLITSLKCSHIRVRTKTSVCSVNCSLKWFQISFALLNCIDLCLSSGEGSTRIIKSNRWQAMWHKLVSHVIIKNKSLPLSKLLGNKICIFYKVVSIPSTRSASWLRNQVLKGSMTFTSTCKSKSSASLSTSFLTSP